MCKQITLQRSVLQCLKYEFRVMDEVNKLYLNPTPFEV